MSREGDGCGLSGNGRCGYCDITRGEWACLGVMSEASSII